MPSAINKYPQFELLEIEPELSIQLKKYRALSPLKKGDASPEFKFSNDFTAWQRFVNGAENFDRIATNQLQNKPLVVAFYSHHWKQKGLEFLLQLSELNTEVKANGGNLVIITDSRNPIINKAAWDYNLTLNFYFDSNHQLAEHFGIYHKDSPVWERFSGIDAHVPLLASFVLTPYNQLTFSHTNWNTDAPVNTSVLLDELYQSGISTKKSA